MRHDICIIGAGADGLAAAATLAARGLKVVVVERDSHSGGCCVTREFYPGFRASPYADELPAIPSDIFRALDLARRGAILVPQSSSLALWSDRQHLVLPWALSGAALSQTDSLRCAIVSRVFADAEARPKRGWFVSRRAAASWPGDEYATRSLADVLTDSPSDPGTTAHRMAARLAGQVCDSALGGSALHLLSGTPGGMAAGGLGRLGDALRAAAEDAGAEISCGLEVSDLKRKNGRVTGIGLADGSELAARAVISTLDLKRTFLSLFRWSELPRAVVDRVANFRGSPGTARLLLALSAPPDLPAGTDRLAQRGPIYISPDMRDEAYRAWRSGAVPQHMPLTVRIVSATDPSLAPDGAACMTVTLGAVPHTPFDGTWTREKRDRLREAALAAIEAVLPGTSARVIGAELIVPPDIENQLGTTDGDLSGGEIAADQMLGQRPFIGYGGTRTPVDGLYLAGPSSTLGPLATCVSGVAAAHAVMTDLGVGNP